MCVLECASVGVCASVSVREESENAKILNGKKLIEVA